MIEFEEMRQLLCRTYSGLRERVVAAADDWIGEGGEFLAFPWMHQLCGLVIDRFQSGDYDQSDALFGVVEKLLSEGNEAIQTVVATGFLEGLQHQRKIAPELWRPLLGPLARSHCEAMDKFHGITR
ncbi:DUF7674 family protein [Duganella qianjiadongensis]|uniref:DUF7674 domain-containing protein n=1 Tax=Duganella qianjiadongensis TaxID=2692176 RepID=A0ABW9VIJ3_9BURK|nr:hypothetical protein [Duganella qianjiadongensis]MYM39434.1 hypothetical protein [Duganella qianjiadongensis]